MMRRTLFALALVGLGWIAARAQSPTPDLELSTSVTREGKITITCVRGCALQWIARRTPNRNEAAQTFSFGCQPLVPCESGAIGAWITR